MNLFYFVANTKRDLRFTKILITSYNPAYRCDCSQISDVSDLYKFGGNVSLFKSDDIKSPDNDFIEDLIEDSDVYEWKFVPVNTLSEFLSKI